MAISKVGDHSPRISLKVKERLGHFGFWVFYLLLPFIQSIGKHTSYNFSSSLIDCFFGMLVFYSTYYFFYLTEKKYWQYLCLAVLFVIIGYLNFQGHNSLFYGSHREVFLSYYAIGYMSTYVVLASFAYLLYSIKETSKSNRALEKVKKEKQEAELSMLKSRINPHFLFNTLNTIYSSALKKDERTAELIIKLSDNFRYVIHEGQNDFVSLKEEIRHLKDYIYLQKERFTDKVHVEISLDIDNYERLIAPLLLMTFVENMFKYTSLLKGSLHLLKIEISLVDDEFYFYCQNPHNLNALKSMDADWRMSGIGISTTRERLNLYYPKKHNLSISNESGMFAVSLKIQL